MRSTALVLCFGAALATAALPAHAVLPPGVDDASIAAAAVATFPEFLDFLALPNDSAKPADIQRNAAWLEAAFARRGFATRQIENKGRPLVFAEYGKARPAQKTVLFYIHFDAQPVVPSQWAQKDPWLPVVKRRGVDGKWAEVDRAELVKPGFDPELRVFARSASDDKGPIVMFLAVFDVLRAKKIEPGLPREGPPRQRGGGRVARHRRGRRFQRGAPLGRRRRPSRRAGPRLEPPDALLREPRRRRRDAHRLRAARAAPQRALRQLGAQSRVAPREAARLDEGRRRAGDGRRVLRAHEPDRRGPQGARGGARRRGGAETEGWHLAAGEGRRHVPGGAPVPVAQRARPRVGERGRKSGERPSARRRRRAGPPHDARVRPGVPPRPPEEARRGAGLAPRRQGPHGRGRARWPKLARFDAHAPEEAARQAFDAPVGRWPRRRSAARGLPRRSCASG